jgi:hypothetical protein
MRPARCDASVTPDLQRRRIIAKGNADILQHPVNLRFDAFNPSGIQRIEMRQHTPDMRRWRGMGRCVR